MIIIGSRALALRVPHLLTRQPEDFDFVCRVAEYEAWFKKNEAKVKPKKVYPEGNKIIIEGLSNCEFEIIETGYSNSNELLEELVKTDKDTIETSFGLVPSLDLLFTIKDAHKYRKFHSSPRMFWKTAIDWHMMRNAGAKVRPEYEAFSKMRKAESYNYAHPKLNQSKKDFFSDDGIKYVYDHDDIHKSVAILDKPAYVNYLRDGAEVDCDKEKFFALPNIIRLNGVIEEACVLAIERSLVPHTGAMTPQDAWRFALAKVCSSITSGWFRQFAYEHLFVILKRYPANYWNKFQADVAKGLVKPFSGSKY